jgi:hypothetical protein
VAFLLRIFGVDESLGPVLLVFGLVFGQCVPILVKKPWISNQIYTGKPMSLQSFMRSAYRGPTLIGVGNCFNNTQI